MEIEDAGESIVLKPIADQTGLVEKEGILIFRGRATDDLGAAIHAHHTARLRKVGGTTG